MELPTKTRIHSKKSFFIRRISEDEINMKFLNGKKKFILKTNEKIENLKKTYKAYKERKKGYHVWIIELYMGTKILIDSIVVGSIVKEDPIILVVETNVCLTSGINLLFYPKSNWINKIVHGYTSIPLTEDLNPKLNISSELLLFVGKIVMKYDVLYEEPNTVSILLLWIEKTNVNIYTGKYITQNASWLACY